MEGAHRSGASFLSTGVATRGTGVATRDEDVQGIEEAAGPHGSRAVDELRRGGGEASISSEAADTARISGGGHGFALLCHQINLRNHRIELRNS
jgi:hypothetical protein